MGAMSDYLEGKLINHLFRSEALPKVQNLYFALLKSPSSDAAKGIEVSGGGYGRVQVAAADANFDAPTAGNGELKNKQPIMFPFPSTNWGAVTHWAVFDEASNGNMLFYGTLEASLNVVANDPPIIFMPGEFSLEFD